MSYAKDHTKTFLWRHRPDVVEAVVNLDVGDSVEYNFINKEQALRFRQRVYSFVKAYFKVQRFGITWSYREGTAPHVITISNAVL